MSIQEIKIFPPQHGTNAFLFESYKSPNLLSFFITFIYTIIIAVENKYYDCRRKKLMSQSREQSEEIVQLTVVVTVWHEDTRKLAVAHFTCHTAHTRRLTSLGGTVHVCTYTYVRVRRIQLDAYGHGVSNVLVSLFCGTLDRKNLTGNHTDSNDGTETEDAYRQREGDEKYHVTRQRPQVFKIARRRISSWTLAFSIIPLRCLWICCIPNHPKYQNGLKERKRNGATVNEYKQLVITDRYAKETDKSTLHRW